MLDLERSTNVRRSHLENLLCVGSHLRMCMLQLADAQHALARHVQIKADAASEPWPSYAPAGRRSTALAAGGQS